MKILDLLRYSARVALSGVLGPPPPPAYCGTAPQPISHDPDQEWSYLTDLGPVIIVVVVVVAVVAASIGLVGFGLILKQSAVLRLGGVMLVSVLLIVKCHYHA